MTSHTKLIQTMIQYEKGCPHQVQHFLKVHNFAKTIAELEQLDPGVTEILEAAAIVHDIGIRPSLEKYQSSNGKYQEQEGPPAARKMLKNLGYPDGFIDRVCYLVAHHHTYTSINGMDYQILVEADFLVNIHEDNMTREAAARIMTNVFKTKSGIKMLQLMYLED